MRATRRLGAAAALTATVALLAACGGGVQPGEATDTGDSGDTNAASGGGASAWGLTGGVHEQLWSASFDWWNEDNPEQPFDVEWFANDAYKEKIRTAVGAGNAPTLIFGWGGGGLKEYVDNGNVVDITDGTTEVIDRVIPSVADGGIVDGQVYAVPNGQSQPVVLYYNADLFEQVGAKVPTTWEEVMEVVPTFNDAGIAPFAVAGQSKWPYLMWIQYLTDRVGGPEVFQAVLDGEADAWSDPAVAEALTMIQDLVEADGFIDGYGSVVADTNADLALIYSGRAAMILQGSWVYSTFKADAEEFTMGGGLGFTTFPEVTGGAGEPGNIVGNTSNYWSVSADASEEAQQTAIEYLDTDVFDEEYTTFLLENGGVPPVLGLEDQIAESEDSAFVDLAYGMVRDAPHFQLSWDQALEPAAAQELLTNLENIFLLQITPQEFVDNMNATIE